MSERDETDAMREAAREVLRELMPDLLREALATEPANGNGAGPAPRPREPDVVPQIPAPPVAAVLRPSGWAGPAVPGEIVGDGSTPPPAEPPPAAPPPANPSPAPGVHVETVTLDTDADLDRFVRALAGRIENPRDRLAIRAGQLRFALRRTPAAGGAATPATRVEKGAVTERAVRAAADGGTRLVLGPRAVLTPLARERARALGVEIERER